MTSMFVMLRASSLFHIVLCSDSDDIQRTIAGCQNTRVVLRIRKMYDVCNAVTCTIDPVSSGALRMAKYIDFLIWAGKERCFLLENAQDNTPCVATSSSIDQTVVGEWLLMIGESVSYLAANKSLARMFL